ncbi:hypothetical protein BH09VER1_BH09VER1_27700 [soil metagenome]
MKPLLSFAGRLSALSLLVISSARAEDPLPLVNPGFENAATGWNSSKEDAAASISQVSPEAAHSGDAGLRVTQADGGPGSWIQGSKVPVEAGKNYRVEFWARCVQDSGIGVWVQFYDAQGKNLTPTNPALWAVQVPQSVRTWAQNHLIVQAPAGASQMTLAVHSYSKRSCLADFDDFSVTPTDETAQAPVPTQPAAAPVAAVASPTPLPAVDPARVNEIAASLDPTPHGIGPSLDDRKAWAPLAADAKLHETIIARAEKYLAEPTPEISNELWMESARTSNRTAEPSIDRRRLRLSTWTLAEGIENQGRFLAAIDQEINAICTEPTWVLPAHDKTLANYNGTRREVDLGTAMTSWTLATADSILGSKLPDATRKLIRDEARRRIIEPFLEESQGKTHYEWWRTHHFNWNAVVHGGVVGTALALDESVQERAEIIASTEKEVPYYLEGFAEDGYSSEGMGYWKYGFGHYIMLAEVIRNATHGKVDLFASERARLVAQFPRRFEITSGIYPGFADSLYMEEPSPWLYHIIDRRYGLNDQVPRTIAVDGMFSTFLYAYGTLLTFDSSAPPVFTEGGDAVQGHRLRDWFEQGQVLIGRLPEGKEGLSLAIKGGTNGASHGHNDLGSFVLLLGNQPLLVDPGSTVYGTTTFGPNRFANQIIGSYGHSVPVVAGKLQREGDAHFATVVSKDFTDARDRITFDLTKGYEVPALKLLTRTVDYDRANGGTVTITDAAELTSPQKFGTAVVTFGDAREEKPGVWTVSQNGKSITIEITAGEAPFKVTNEVLKDEARAGKVRRLGIDLIDPVTKAAIILKITPSPAAVVAGSPR